MCPEGCSFCSLQNIGSIFHQLSIWKKLAKEEKVSLRKDERTCRLELTLNVSWKFFFLLPTKYLNLNFTHLPTEKCGKIYLNFSKPACCSVLVFLLPAVHHVLQVVYPSGDLFLLCNISRFPIKYFLNSLILLEYIDMSSPTFLYCQYSRPSTKHFWPLQTESRDS